MATAPRIEIDSELILETLNRKCKDTLMETLEITYSEVGEDYLCCRMPITPKVMRPGGVLHGGASLALFETVGSSASLLFIDNEHYIVVGIEIAANHVKIAREGTLTACATAIHIGRSTHLFEVRITDDKGELISFGKITNMVLPKKVI